MPHAVTASGKALSPDLRDLQTECMVLEWATSSNLNLLFIATLQVDRAPLPGFLLADGVLPVVCQERLEPGLLWNTRCILIFVVPVGDRVA